MNCCIFSGRLTRDADLRYAQSGKSVLNFSLAVESGYGDRKQTLFLNCAVWEKEKLAQYMTKGKAVLVRGELTMREYQDKNGNDRKVTEILVRDIEFQQGGGEAGRHKRNDDLGPPFPTDTNGMDQVPF